MNLGDIEDLVPDYHNKENIAIKQIMRIFWFPSAYKDYVYVILHSIKCAIALCLKNNVHTLVKKYFTTKNANHHLSVQQVVILWLVGSLASMLMAADRSVQ